MYIYKGGKNLLQWHAGVQDKQQVTFAWSTEGWTDNEMILDQQMVKLSGGHTKLPDTPVTITRNLM